MQLIVKCPAPCYNRTAVKIDSENASEIISNEEKRCPKCQRDLNIHVEVNVTVKGFEPAPKERSIQV